MKEKEKPLNLYWILIKTTFVLSIFTIGGGYVIVPLMQKKFVEELGWIDTDEMLDLVALGQSIPGSLAVNVSILVGYRIAGISGAMITVLGTVSPPLLIITVISYFYMSFRDNPIVDALMLGMQIGVVAVILNVVYSMIKDIWKTRDLINMFILIGAFVAGFAFDINIILIILIAGIMGFLNYMWKIKKGGA
ncbi:chromate transporter [Jeotgalibaca ciconiae]|uniref:Chromate transporter n=1 Tax=Jeotgalibaca ciconiae TaxID=2496265 RepID=A0A3Q9BIS1_9LACT|nr:chromate transporter [Jeotgalibaca ciconiae]AZP03318.1 chromate transporter [Jeotgalibaca ciconiae]HJB23390.1 chromate transporter [Candidatus Jeotgalibaca pullicola]